MSENNNGLNEFNKRQINNRQSRVRRRNLQRIAVLSVFLVIVAILVAVLWLVILDVKENLENRVPGEETQAPLESGNNLEPPTSSGPSNETEPAGSESETETSTPDTEPPETNPAYNTLTKVYTRAQIYTGSLLLINEDHPFVTPADITSRLETVKLARDARPKINNSYTLWFMASFVQVDSSITTSLLDMADACSTATNIYDLCLSTSGAYRTFDEQKELFDSNITSIPAGCSDFNSGLSVYFVGYPDDPIPSRNPALDDAAYANGAVMAEWLEANAYKYGFIKRYTSAKVSITGQPEDVGHYRYVGYPHSYIMKTEDLCLEEYISNISRYTANGEHYVVTADDGHTYEIYYVASEGDITNVTVPASLPYTVSGDNYGGYIVTVTLD